MNINKSPRAIAETLGNRLKQVRLNANLSQEALALIIGVLKNTIVNAEAGKSKLETMIAMIQGIGLLDQLSLFLPEQPASPIQLVKMKGAQRKPASKSIVVQSHEKTKRVSPNGNRCEY